MTSTHNHLAKLIAIGWRADAPWPELPDGNILARVIAQHRNGYRVHDGCEEFNAQPAPHFLKRKFNPSLRPAVGDFVSLATSKPPLITVVMPRRSVLSRASAGERYERQLIATNIDHVMVLMGLDGDFNPRRIERYLLLIRESSARPVIILSKMDLFKKEQCEEALTSIRTVLPAEIPVHLVNAKDSASLAVLKQYLEAGNSAVLVGSSGAGKSTLTNSLLGKELQSTNAVRKNDSRGRHTTTHRSLIQLPSGGCLIDTPGMRELKLTGEEDLSAASFADIEELISQCRFGDCRHNSEPDCAVRAAIDAGTLDLGRWDNYKKLSGELAVANDSRAAQLKRKLARR